MASAWTFELCVKWWAQHCEAVSSSQIRFLVITEKKLIFKGLQVWFVTLQIVLEANPDPILGEHKRNMWKLEAAGAYGRHSEVGHILWEAVTMKNTCIALRCSCHLQGCDTIFLRGIVKKKKKKKSTSHSLLFTLTTLYILKYVCGESINSNSS